MTNRSRDELLAVVTPPRLNAEGLDMILDLTLIANLASIDDDGGIHVVPIWFKRDGSRLLMPTSRLTRKYRNLVRRPRASVMIDLSRAGLDLRGALIRGPVEIIEGEEARELNRSIHLRYVSSEGLLLPEVKAYLVEGDDVTLSVSMEHTVTWNHAMSAAARALGTAKAFHPLDS